MNKEPFFPDSPGEGDNWESLSENLFGIDFGKDSETGKNIPSEDVSTGESGESPVPVDPKEASSGTPNDVDPDEESDVVDEMATHGTGDEPAVDKAVSVPEARDDDTYWGMLQQWEWDESGTEESSPIEDRKFDAASSSSRTPEEPSPAESAAETSFVPDDHSVTAADFHDEYIDDAEFGAGLLEDDESPLNAVSERSLETKDAIEPGTAKTPPVSPPLAGGKQGGDETQTQPAIDVADEAEAAPRKRRRRRRRRRPRAAESERATDEISEGQVVDFGAGVEEVVAEEPGQDKEAEDSAVEEPQKTKRPARRRSSRRRRKSASVKTTEEKPVTKEKEQDSAVADAELEPEPDHDEAAGDESTHEVSSAYKDIPTWEEAISYLLNPSVAESGGAQKVSKSDSSRASGRRGRRRR